VHQGHRRRHDGVRRVPGLLSRLRRRHLVELPARALHDQARAQPGPGQRLKGGPMRLFVILICASIARAAAPLPPAPTTVVAPPPKPPKKFVVYTSLAFNVYTYLGATPTAKAVSLTPADRAILGEQ